MRIAILGTICYDRVLTHLGETKESFGGITYNVAALESLIDDGTQLVPIANVGYDRYDQVIELLSGYRGVSTEGLVRMDDMKIASVELVYKTISERSEALLYIPPPLSEAQLDLAASCDAILLNFITGQEMKLDTLRALKAKAKGHLHLDIHNVISIWTPEGPRKFVGLPDWQSWLANADTVQMNEFEVEQLLRRDVRTEGKYLEAAAEVLCAGPMAVAVTLGPSGSVMAYRRQEAPGADPVTYGIEWPAAELGKVVDTTGCGDSYSAGFIWSYLQSRDLVRANAAANIVGGVNCITPGIGNLQKAREMDTLIPQAWPELAERVAGGWIGDRLS